MQTISIQVQGSRHVNEKQRNFSLKIQFIMLEIKFFCLKKYISVSRCEDAIIPHFNLLLLWEAGHLSLCLFLFLIPGGAAQSQSLESNFWVWPQLPCITNNHNNNTQTTTFTTFTTNQTQHKLNNTLHKEGGRWQPRRGECFCHPPMRVKVRGGGGQGLEVDGL